MNVVEANRGWRDYWKTDQSASCVPDNPATQAQIAGWWQDFFAVLGNGSRILDIATGNGIVLAHAGEAAARHGVTFDLTGIDLADIDPSRYLLVLPPGLGGATFLGKVPAENLPFPDACFDVAVSQYGLEYAEPERALAEAARVLTPGGRLRWLAHSVDSAVVRQNRDEYRQVDFLLANGGPVESMVRLVDAIQRRRGVQPAANALGRALHEAQRFCHCHPPSATVQEVCHMLAEVGGRWQAYYVSDLHVLIRDTRNKLVEHKLRTEDLCAAVLTPQRHRRVRDILETAP